MDNITGRKIRTRNHAFRSRCRIHEEMVEGEMKSWARYWAAYHAGGTAQTELDQLLQEAASESAAIEVHSSVLFVLKRVGHMAPDIKEAVHALSRKMAEEKDPEKLALLKQQLRQLFQVRDADSKEEPPSEDASS